MKWISVKDRTPKTFERVIVCREGGIVEQGYKDVGDWWKVYGTRTKKVTHWMPLPEPPDEGTAKKRFEEQKKKLIEAAQASERKAKDAEARVEELRRKLSTASKETAQFELMFRTVQEDFAELLKMVSAIEDGNAELGEKLRKAIAAVAEEILKKVGRV